MDSDSVCSVVKIIAYARVCLRMIPRAASASVARAVSRGAHVDQADLDLTGPERDCPFAVDGDPAAPSASLEEIRLEHCRPRVVAPAGAWRAVAGARSFLKGSA